ncbi:hypothetical protein [Sphingopyxis sp.]|uniref:DUF5983 family protein n=1 Tax=Sphingopyxis sp. TaxID=1908224 RepID=UPI002D796F09|nr:hypothetical protein [Sphingopyxis sp.]HET6525043.1 hypothetical protein [Sphingopyxis sp.]
MSDISIRAFAQLLARARAAIETPADLDDAARTAVIEDIAAFGDNLAQNAIPWGFDIHIGSIDHKHGTNHYAALTQEALMAEVAEYCRIWWSEIDDERDPATLDDEMIATTYFEDHPTEYLKTDRVHINPPSANMQTSSLETGHYCVVTTAHLSNATAGMLDEWCAAATADRPINVASTIYGWFVPARDVDEPTRAKLPADLLAAMKFARAHGFDHILFDCDAGSVEALPKHDW